MPDGSIASWPQVRFDPAVKKRMEDVLARAGDRSSLTRIVNSLLDEAIAQIEVQGDNLPPPFLPLPAYAIC